VGSLIDDPSTWDSGDFEQRLEGSATDIPGQSQFVTQRTGIVTTECWESAGCPLEATGSGWVFVDDALAAVP